MALPLTNSHFSVGCSLQPFNAPLLQQGSAAMDPEISRIALDATPQGRFLQDLTRIGLIDEHYRLTKSFSSIAAFPCDHVQSQWIDAFLMGAVELEIKDNESCRHLTLCVGDLLHWTSFQWGPNPVPIQLIGGFVRKLILSSPACVRSIFSEALARQEIPVDALDLPDTLFEGGGRTPPDIDLRFRLPPTKDEEAIKLGTQSLVNLFAHNLPQDSPYWIKNNAFEKFNKINFNGNKFTIASFGKVHLPGASGKPPSLEMLFVESLAREELFLLNSFSMNLSVHPTFSPERTPALPRLYFESPQFMQALVDLLGGVIHIDDPQGVDIFGFPMLISYFSLGFVLGDVLSDGRDVIKILMDKVTKLSQYQLGVVDQIATLFETCLENHHGSSDTSRFTLAFNACVFLEESLSEQDLRTLWVRLTGKIENLESLPPVMRDCLKAVGKDHVPFKEAACVLALGGRFRKAQIRESGASQALQVNFKKTQGRIALQISIREPAGEHYLLIPYAFYDCCQRLETFLTDKEINNSQKEALIPLLKTILYDGAVASDPAASLETILTAAEISTPQSLDLQQKWAGSPSKTLRFLGYHLTLASCMAHDTPRERYLFCFDRFLEHLDAFQDHAEKSLYKKHVQSVLDRSPLSHLVRSPQSPLELPLEEPFSGYAAKKLFPSWVVRLAAAQDASLSRLAYRQWLKAREKFGVKKRLETDSRLIAALLPGDFDSAFLLFKKCRKDMTKSPTHEAELITLLLKNLPWHACQAGIDETYPELIASLEALLERPAELSLPEPVALISLKKQVGRCIGHLIVKEKTALAAKLITLGSPLTAENSPFPFFKEELELISKYLEIKAYPQAFERWQSLIGNEGTESQSAALSEITDRLIDSLLKETGSSRFLLMAARIACNPKLSRISDKYEKLRLQRLNSCLSACTPKTAKLTLNLAYLGLPFVMEEKQPSSCQERVQFLERVFALFSEDSIDTDSLPEKLAARLRAAFPDLLAACHALGKVELIPQALKLFPDFRLSNSWKNAWIGELIESDRHAAWQILPALRSRCDDLEQAEVYIRALFKRAQAKGHEAFAQTLIAEKSLFCESHTAQDSFAILSETLKALLENDGLTLAFDLLRAYPLAEPQLWNTLLHQVSLTEEIPLQESALELFHSAFFQKELCNPALDDTVRCVATFAALAGRLNSPLILKIEAEHPYLQKLLAAHPGKWAAKVTRHLILAHLSHLHKQPFHRQAIAHYLQWKPLSQENDLRPRLIEALLKALNPQSALFCAEEFLMELRSDSPRAAPKQLGQLFTYALSCDDEPLHTKLTELAPSAYQNEAFHQESATICSALATMRSENALKELVRFLPLLGKLPYERIDELHKALPAVVQKLLNESSYLDEIKRLLEDPCIANVIDPMSLRTMWWQWMQREESLLPEEDYAYAFIAKYYRMIAHFSKIEGPAELEAQWSKKVIALIPEHINTGHWLHITEMIRTLFSTLDKEKAFYQEDYLVPDTLLHIVRMRCIPLENANAAQEAFREQFFQVMTHLLERLIQAECDDQIAASTVSAFIQTNLMALIQSFPSAGPQLAQLIDLFIFSRPVTPDQSYQNHQCVCENLVYEAMKIGAYDKCPQILVQAMIFLTFKTCIPENFPLEKQKATLVNLIKKTLKMPAPHSIVHTVKMLQGVESIIFKEAPAETMQSYALLLSRYKECPYEIVEDISIFEWIRVGMMNKQRFVCLLDADPKFQTASALSSMLFEKVFGIYLEASIPQDFNYCSHALLDWLFKHITLSRTYGAFNLQAGHAQYFELVRRIFPYAKTELGNFDKDYKVTFGRVVFKAVFGLDDLSTAIGKTDSRKFAARYSKEIKKARAYLALEWIKTVLSHDHPEFPALSREFFNKAQQLEMFTGLKPNVLKRLDQEIDKAERKG